MRNLYSKLFTLFFAILILCNANFAQTVPPAGFAFAIGASTGYCINYGITNDAPGNTYVTGTFQGTADTDPSASTHNLTSTGGNTGATTDIFVAKYSSTGAYVWAFTMGSGAIVNNNNMGTSIAVDNSGNVYVTGGFTGTVDFDPSAGSHTLTSKGAYDVFIAKYNSNGAYINATAFGGTGSDFAQKIKLDAAGNVYLTGSFSATVNFNPAGTANRVSAGSGDAFAAKYDNNFAYLWAIALGSTNSDAGYGLAADENNVYVTGTFYNTVNFDPAGTANLTSNGGSDVFVAKYSSAGAYQWAINFGAGINGNYDKGQGIVVDSYGDVLVTGTVLNTAGGTINFDPNGTHTVTFAVNAYSSFLAKYNADGKYIWAFKTNNSGSGLPACNGADVACDEGNNVVITGSYTQTCQFDPAGLSAAGSKTSASSYAAYVAKYNPDGTLQWVFDVPGYYTYSNSICYNTSNNKISITGFFETSTTLTTAKFDPTSSSYNLTASTNSANYMFIANYVNGKTWTGGTGTWSTAANWTPSGVPSLYDNILIASGSPAVTGTATASSIIVNSPGTLVIPAAATLQTGGALVTTGGITATAGNITYKGLYNQRITPAPFATGVIKDLTIDNGIYGVSVISKISVTGALTVASGDSLYIGDTLQLGGTVSNSGVIHAANGTVTFNGSAAQALPANTFMNNTVKNLVMNNASGLTVNSDNTVSNELTLTAGNITTGANKLMLTSGAAVSGGSASSFINGYLSKTGSQAFVFPVGKGSKYAPIAITASINPANVFTASYYPSNVKILYPTSTLVAGITSLSDKEYWMLTRDAGSSNVDVILYWDQTRSGTIGSLSDVYVSGIISNQWYNQGNTATTGTPVSGTVTSDAGLAFYGAFTFASSTAVLPLKLLSFTAQRQNDRVILNWKTSNEVNTAYFNIQRSSNGTDFLNTGKTFAKGNSATYQFTDILNADEQQQPKLFYRLQMFDKDGNFTYGKIVSASTRNTAAVSFYPNPVKEVIYISGAVVSAEIFDLSGRRVIQKQLSGNHNPVNIASLGKGLYILKLTDSAGKVMSETVIKE